MRAEQTQNGLLGSKGRVERRVSSSSHGGGAVGETVGLLPMLPFYESTCVRGLGPSVSSSAPCWGEMFC